LEKAARALSVTSRDSSVTQTHDTARPPDDVSSTVSDSVINHKVSTVPGEFFGVNPGKRRRGESPYRRWMRFSFGPPIANLAMGLDRLEGMIRGA